MKKYTVSILIVAVSLIFLAGYQTLPLYGQDKPLVVHDRYDVPMVFVPAGNITIGATLDEASEACEKLRLENKTARAGNCRRALSDSVPDGVDFFITPVQAVSLKDYFIDEYEVTIQSYQVCVDANVCNGDVLVYLRGFSP